MVLQALKLFEQKCHRIRQKCEPTDDTEPGNKYSLSFIPFAFSILISPTSPPFVAITIFLPQGCYSNRVPVLVYIVSKMKKQKLCLELEAHRDSRFQRPKRDNCCRKYKIPALEIAWRGETEFFHETRA